MSGFSENKYDFEVQDNEEWILVHSGAVTNTNPGSMVYVSINTTPICSNMSNKEFRKLVMRARDAAISLIQQRIAGVTMWNVAEQARARLYFGRADNDIRATLAIGLPRLLIAVQELVPEKIVRWDDTMNKRLTCGVVPDSGSNTAAVCKPDSEKRIIAIYSKFCRISNGDLWTAAKVKTLIHECTHYIDTFNSDDIAYSDTESGLRIFAMNNPDSAIRNADSITGYVATFDRKVME
ncbi:M35 family metallo-endopeptidase [Burkholderia lata]|uniref:Peptidase M35 n=1 Tax=Burkholderia lata (strain ATCC 17760 / DSM 23089 / LMG 22485 / NCIMB 9086 / R18194 / 383) TaxID=482957 RepID=A0A6P2JRQ4_BURL3|nr:M35 family metallo-endopeptidase [Burkholderia lata]VWB47115.1 peptidase M35 [Burkholderia lata]VWC43612.1 peptidase M35 [Burkholderia lata]